MAHPVRAISVDQAGVAEYLGRAYAALRSGRNAEADEACQEALLLQPGQPDACHLLGLLAYAAADLDLAVEWLRQACEDEGASAHCLSDFAEICRQTGHLAEGERAARRATALAPDLAGAWNNLGIILQERLELDESRLCLERVLAIEPRNASALNNLANTCKRLGRSHEARERLHAALSVRPDYAEAYSNLSNVLCDEGDYDEAEAMGRKALELNPRLADAYLNLAGVANARHRHSEALGWLDALLAFAPAHAGGHSERARTLKALGRLDEAMDAAERAVLMAPGSAETHNALGQVFQAKGEFQPALDSYDRAVALPGSGRSEAISNRGLILAEFGRADEARAALAGAAAMFPHSAFILFNLAELTTMAPGDPLIGRMEAALAEEGRSALDRTMLHFGLGKALLDTDPAEAFRHYDEGNRLRRASFAYDPDTTDHWMAEIARVFSPDLLKARADRGARSDRPVLVVGMPRSGTTLVEQILASHPDVVGAGERITLQALASAAGFPDTFPTLADERLGAIGEAYLATLTRIAQGRKHVVDKMPANFALAGMIRLILPDARIIHCRRDPADICFSCYIKLFSEPQAFAYSQTELGRFYRASERLAAHWRAGLPASHFLEIDYEALVNDFEPQARRLLDFLGLQWDARVLGFHETLRQVRTASSLQVRQPLYRSSIGRWRRYALYLQPLLAELGRP
jgi:tetratricopeptide (TPR) repeat protein